MMGKNNESRTYTAGFASEQRANIRKLKKYYKLEKPNQERCVEVQKKYQNTHHTNYKCVKVIWIDSRMMNNQHIY